MVSKLFSDTKAIQKTGSKNSYPGKPLTEIVTNGFFTVDRKWTVKYWNKAAEKILGVKAENIIGKNLWEKFAGILPLNFYAVYHKAFLQEIPVHFEEYWGEMGAWFDMITYHCDDTLSVSFKSSGQLAEPDNPGEPGQLAGSGQPTTQLQILNELYRFVTHVTNDCLWEWDLEAGDIFWIDGGHKRVFGYSIENALIPQEFWEGLIHPEDKIRILTTIKRIVSEGSTEWEDEYRFRKANGEYAYVHDRGHIIYDDDNLGCRMIGATQDITARKTALNQLLESEKKLALIAKQTINALIVADEDGKITWVNDAFTGMTGYRPEEVLGRNLGSFLQGKDTNPATLQYLRQKIRAKEVFNCEILNYSKAGRKYWMHIQGQPLVDENGNSQRYFIIETDVTERVLLENKLAEERKARHREITEAVLTAQEKERADIGKEMHDNLNQILAVAKLHIQMAQSEEKNREENLEKSCGLIVNVIEEIRRIAKNLVIPGVHIIGLIDNIKNLLYDLTMIHPIKIDFHSDGIDDEVLNEKLQITIFRIVQEQMNNILKHAGATYAIINLIAQENKLILLISDNGVGCDTTKEKEGVGIINIKSRAELYNGSVTILSKPGEGYELKVVLSLDGHS